MPKCSIIGCGSRLSENQQRLSLHRLPRNEYNRKKWIEAIGSNNINAFNKEIFICSLHFNESAFNRTLGVVRLRDDAVPSCLLVPETEIESKLTENRSNPILIHQSVPDLVPVETVGSKIVPEPEAGPSRILEVKDQSIAVKKLELKCNNLKKKIKRLNETVRRQKIKIAFFFFFL